MDTPEKPEKAVRPATKSVADRLDKRAVKAWVKVLTGLQEFVATLQEIDATQAYLQLGFKSMAAYVEARFVPSDEYMITAEHRQLIEVPMRQMGIPLRAIGSVLGVAPTTVSTDLGKAGAAAAARGESLDLPEQSQDRRGA